MGNTAGIHNVISRAARRLKLQSALEAATLAFIGSCVGVLIAIFLFRLGRIEWSTALTLMIASGALTLIGAIAGYSKKISTNHAATIVDRYSGLSDRLASACAFEAALKESSSKAGEELDDETQAMMRLAIADAVAKVGAAKPKEATPFKAPKDGRAALAFAFVTALLASISLPKEPVDPVLAPLNPSMGAVKTRVVAQGQRLLTPAGPANTVVLIGEGEALIETKALVLQGSHIEFEIPAETPVGMTSIQVRVGSRLSNARPFEVLAKSDPRSIPEDHIVLEEEDLDYTKELVAELKATATENEDQELQELAEELEDLVSKAEKGELTKKQLLEAITKAEEKYMEGSEEALEEVMSDLQKAGKELKKDQVSKELGKALEKGDLDKAKEEFEKLADKLEKGELSEKQEKKLGEMLDKAAEKMAKAEEKRDQQMDQRIAKKEEAIRRLQKKQQEAKTQQEQEEVARRLKREKRELKKLQRNKEQKEQSSSKRELKQLRRKMSEAAKDLKRQQPQQQRQKSRRQTSERMKDIARSTGKVSNDKRKMANKPKVATQMGDLKEAMRRAKRKGKGGAKNRFGRNRKNRDFGQRARGGQGQKGAWKPGQGTKPGQGKGQKGQGQGQKGQGQGQGQGDAPYGDGHDPNVMGDPTKMAGNTEDEQLQGVRGKGPSTRETILTAAQKGFSARSYKNVFAKYKTAIEEDMKAEKLPSGYKYYVKRYFQKIKPASR